MCNFLLDKQRSYLMFPSLEWATTQGSLQWRVHIILHSLQIQQYAGHTINQYKLIFPLFNINAS